MERSHASLRIATPFGHIAAIDVGPEDDGGRPPIVFVHGVPLNSAHWQSIIARLSPRWRCFAPDLLGLGATDPREGVSPDFPTQAKMILSCLDALEIERFHLVGNDSGGAIAQILACMAPKRIASLTLTNCEVGGHAVPAAFAASHTMAKAGQLAQAMAAMCTDINLARSTGGLGMAFENIDHITPALIDTYIAPLVGTAVRRRWLDAYVAAIRPEHLLAVQDHLSTLDMPTQLLWADSDVYFPMDDAWQLARSITGFRRLVVAKGARLFFCEERPDWGATQIESFLDQAGRELPERELTHDA